MMHVPGRGNTRERGRPAHPKPLGCTQYQAMGPRPTPAHCVGTVRLSACEGAPAPPRRGAPQCAADHLRTDHTHRVLRIHGRCRLRHTLTHGSAAFITVTASGPVDRERRAAADAAVRTRARAAFDGLPVTVRKLVGVGALRAAAYPADTGRAAASRTSRRSPRSTAGTVRMATRPTSGRGLRYVSWADRTPPPLRRTPTPYCRGSGGRRSRPTVR